ncbi:MAG: hypothetical protein N4A76_13515 [Firmicutes bacterium]|jgi:predicted RNase H-like HicB family nuclease|nr:hypothetical protein [Bacillota bacterium]
MIVSGSILIFISLSLLGRELKKSNSNAQSFNNSSDIIQYIHNMEKTLNEMNESFYEICNELEGNYSVHDKELQLMYNEIQSLKKANDNVKKVQKKMKKDLRSEINEKNESNDKENKYQKISFENHDSNNQLEKGTTTREKVKYLHKLGKSPSEIARVLNIGIGEVELFINIKK